MIPSVRLVVGLGNPSARYAGTRHNIGFEVLDALLNANRQKKVPVENLRWPYDAELFAMTIGPNAEKRYVAKPTTYVNRSGQAVQALIERLGAVSTEALVIVDDFALPLGKLRLRPRGSDGGHNGLASIIETLGTEDFPRLRLGIGPVPEGIPPEDFVLSPFRREERATVEHMVNEASEAVQTVIAEGLERAMNTVNAG